MIRVLRVITRMNIGGPALHVSLLARRLDPARFETLLVTGREERIEGSMAEIGRIRPVRTTAIPELARSISPVSDIRAMLRMLSLVDQFRPVIVHTHLAKAGLIGRAAARLKRVPIVVHTFHGSVFHGYFGRHGSTMYRYTERALAGVTDRIIAVTRSQRDELIELGVAPPAKVVEIALGFELGPFEHGDREAGRARLGLPTDVLAVGIVARLVPIKDVGTFLRGVSSLLSRVPHVRAVVVGDGEERSRLEALARELGIADRCTFAGWQGDMPHVMAALDVVALTSLNEGSPVSLIEALAAGRPVVATAVGGVPDIVRDGITGVLIAARDPVALADALDRLIHDPVRRERLATAGRAEVHRRFSADRLVSDTAALYERLLTEKRITR